MAAKLNVFNLGDVGVNLSPDPIHRTDGEMTQAQNAAFRRDQASGGLGKRGGIAKLNSAAMAGGSVLAAADVPFPDPSAATRYLYAALGTADANTWARSADGLSWTAVTVPQDAARGQNDPIADQYFRRAVGYGNKLYYPGDDFVQYPTASHTGPTLRAWDGVNDIRLLRLPYNPLAGSATNAKIITDMWIRRGWIYVACYDPDGVAPNHRGRVFKLDPQSGALTQVGNRFGGGTGEAVGGMPYCGCAYLGSVWVGTMGISGNAVGLIYRINPLTASIWTLDHTTAVSQGYIMSLAVYRGELFAATMADAGFQALVKRRTTAGVWSASDTGGGGATTFGMYGPLIVFEDVLYAIFVEPGANKTLIRAFNGTAWSTSLDVGVTYAVRNIGQPVVYQSNLYVPFCAASLANSNGFILKKAAGGGAWSQVLANANIRGFMSAIRIDA